MLSKRPPHTPSGNFTRYRATKAVARPRRIRDSSSSGSSRRLERHRRPANPPDASTPSPSTSPIVTLRVGPEKRLFAAHEAILSASPFSQQNAKRKDPPEVLSCVLEYLYKGDYYPRLQRNSQRQTWELEDGAIDSEGQSVGATVYHHAARTAILRDTAIYCAAEKYNLPTLQRLALRKQGLHTGIQCNTILSSARYAYANTPDSDSKLRAHYLALIIRSRG
ncbi:hypothetical protein N7526_008824 [Penicillium atrosanguineum]|nr:hypothetical protein N7526_008824 [Penicillium atrosanguineum]